MNLGSDKAILRKNLPWSATVILCAAMASFVHAALPSGITAQSPPSCDVAGTFARADNRLKGRHFSEAKIELKTLEGCKNLTPEARFNMGWLFGRSHDFRAALKIFQSLPLNVPDKTTHQYAVALTQFELGDYQASTQSLKSMATDGPLDAKSANLLGVCYSKLNHYQEAYDVLRENLRRNPSDLRGYLNVITLFADTGHFSDAVEIANQAAAEFPSNPEVITVRGAVYTLIGELDNARSDFAEAVRLTPHSASARFFLALAEYRQGDFDASSATIGAAIESGIADSDLHYLLAECLLKTDPTHPARAMDELNRAIELNSKAVASRTLRGKLLLDAGKAKEAATDLELAHRTDPSSRSAAYNLARADFKLGKTQEANALFQKLQNANNDSLTELSDQRLHQTLGGPSQ